MHSLFLVITKEGHHEFVPCVLMHCSSVDLRYHKCKGVLLKNAAPLTFGRPICPRCPLCITKAHNVLHNGSL